jgi:hypothetical protein
VKVVKVVRSLAKTPAYFTALNTFVAANRHLLRANSGALHFLLRVPVSVPSCSVYMTHISRRSLF